MKVILFSGGMDSSLLAKTAKDTGQDTRLLFVHYNQNHAEREWMAAQRIAKHLGLPLTRRALLMGGLMVKGRSPVVPGRNALLLSYAVNFAAAHGADTVEIGCCAADARLFPDCRPEFIRAFNTMLSASELPVRVDAPLLLTSKRVIRAGLGRIFGATWSCYYPQRDGRGCAQCEACRERGTA